ncbi:acylphosphatase [Desulfuromonas carbonis]|uniref:acylphosphatase n=1 Tax=Desulfuromonas sp. DDH964 TaxID=1823759 RepID=UPI00078DAD61|nr:acylphosphatase [Desulfuromonas sp. DDH964]AMV73122.1 acylphosphatase [Desulfuromonas sp. DDH964]
MEPARVLVTIRGRVQGVGFRYFTLRAARELGLRGWVRNLPNGDVEALFEGERATIEEALATCRQGPPASRVEELHCSWQQPGDTLIDFSIR